MIWEDLNYPQTYDRVALCCPPNIDGYGSKPINPFRSHQNRWIFMDVHPKIKRFHRYGPIPRWRTAKRQRQVVQARLAARECPRNYSEPDNISDFTMFFEEWISKSISVLTNFTLVGPEWVYDQRWRISSLKLQRVSPIIRIYKLLLSIYNGHLFSHPYSSLCLPLFTCRFSARTFEKIEICMTTHPFVLPTHHR